MKKNGGAFNLYSIDDEIWKLLAFWDFSGVDKEGKKNQWGIDTDAKWFGRFTNEIVGFGAVGKTEYAHLLEGFFFLE